MEAHGARLFATPTTWPLTLATEERAAVAISQLESLLRRWPGSGCRFICGRCASDIRISLAADAVFLIEPFQLRCFGRAIILLLLLGCERGGIVIHFVVPNNYRGTFKVIVDDARGRQIVPMDRTYTLEIPESGILIVKKEIPFLEWHQESASYKSGLPIPNASSVSSQSVAYDGVTTDSANGQLVHWFLIGTEQEKQHALRKGFLRPTGSLSK